MPTHPFGWLSLLPPVVAIAMAVITRRVVLSLVLGVFAGALVMSGGDPLTAIHHTWETHLWNTLIDAGKLRVFSFTLLMGAMIGVITRSGGMRGLIELVTPYAQSRRTGQLATWFLGLLIFFDDYANTILLGSTMRPICDRLKISRQKLAYLVDSTAAPVAGLVPLSTWVAVEVDYIASGLDSISVENASAFGLFLESIPYRFYIWTALLLVPLTILLRRDFGPMVDAERRAASETHDAVTDQEDAVDETRHASWLHAVLPIVLTLATVVYFIYSTGSRAASDAAVSAARSTAQSLVSSPSIDEPLARMDSLVGSGSIRAVRNAVADVAAVVSQQTGLETPALPAALRPGIGLRDIVGAADSSLALQYGSLAGLLLAGAMALAFRLLDVDQLLSSAFDGAKIVLPAVAILWTASAMSRMTTNTSVDGQQSETPYQFQDHRLYTAEFLADVVAGPDDPNAQSAAGNARVSVRSLPTIVFVLAAVVAFATGTSWGTMGILVPMVIQTAHALLSQATGTMSLSDPILLSSIGGVLAGAIFGDHCSPISDTTVLSSQSCGCDHLSHVWTQMPYALLAALVSILLGTLPIGYGVSVWVLLPAQILALVVLVRLLGQRSTR